MSTEQADYFEAGAERARALGNRGALRFDADGRLATDIREALTDIGYYIFAGVVDDAELAELDEEFEAEEAIAAPAATVPAVRAPPAAAAVDPFLTNLPAVPDTKVQAPAKTDEEKELEALQAEMAL